MDEKIRTSQLRGDGPSTRPPPKSLCHGPNLVFEGFGVAPHRPSRLPEALRGLMSAFRRWKSSSPGWRSSAECLRPAPLDRSNRVRWGWSTLRGSKEPGQRPVAVVVPPESPRACIRQRPLINYHGLRGAGITKGIAAASSTCAMRRWFYGGTCFPSTSQLSSLSTSTPVFVLAQPCYPRNTRR